MIYIYLYIYIYIYKTYNNVPSRLSPYGFMATPELGTGCTVLYHIYTHYVGVSVLHRMRLVRALSLVKYGVITYPRTYKAALMRRKRRNMHVCRWYYAPPLRCC